MNMSMSVCKKYLTTLWFVGSCILFFILLIQSILGKYGARATDAWSWFFPTIMPTLSLVVGVLVMDVMGKGTKMVEIDSFFFKLTFGISTAYLLAVLLVFLLQPLTASSPFEIMIQSNLWLGPFQGLVAASMGAFFVKAPDEKKLS